MNSWSWNSCRTSIIILLTHLRKFLIFQLTCPGRIHSVHRHLAPGARCSSAVDHAVPWLQDAELVVDLEQLVGASAPEVLGTRRFHVRVSGLPLQPALLGTTFTFRQTQRRVKIPRLKVKAQHSCGLSWTGTVCSEIMSCVCFGRARLREIDNL